MAPRLGGKVLLHTLVWSLLGALSICSEEDISCLKSIKDSLDGPHDFFKSWNFNDNGTQGFICRFGGVECWQPEENRVMNIRLANMSLKGQFPQAIKKCRSLTGLDLSNNELSGPIPSNISEIIPYVTSLDLSSNRFSGNIPKQLASCSFLNVLKLDNNQLTGEIPIELVQLNRIKVFSVSNNQLSGPVPQTFPFTSESYAANPGLCGFPLEPCNAENSNSNFFESFKKGFTIGYMVSLASVISTFMSYFAPWLDRDEKKKLLRQFILTLVKSMKRIDKRSENSHHASKLLHLDLLHEDSRETSMLSNMVSRMSYSDISEATNNFSEENIIGFGQMGTTYKATLPNGWLLAIKRLCNNTQTFDEHFITELKTLGRLRHHNLVPLIGFCIKSKEKLLVYTYMSNGNLYDWLHPAEGEAKFIDWPLRVKIAHGVSRGLVWLHQNCNLRVVHLDICSKCILLDQNFEPKISNFGEAMVIMKSNKTDRIGGGSFYVDSGYWKLSFVKEDVYCFGILLLELITGHDPSKLTEFDAGDESRSKWVVDISERADFYDIVDKSLIGRGFDPEIFQIFRVACDCVQLNPDTRPTMLEVHRAIRTVGERHGIKTGSDHMANECLFI